MLSFVGSLQYPNLSSDVLPLAMFACLTFVAEKTLDASNQSAIRPMLLPVMLQFPVLADLHLPVQALFGHKECAEVLSETKCQCQCQCHSLIDRWKN